MCGFSTAQGWRETGTWRWAHRTSSRAASCRSACVPCRGQDGIEARTSAGKVASHSAGAAQGHPVTRGLGSRGGGAEGWGQLSG